MAVKGGIGDFLQYLPYMLDHPRRRYLVASHQDCVEQFFARFAEIRVEEVSLGRLGGIEICPRTRFFDHNPFPRSEPLFSDGRPVIGVHLGGSDYSLSVERRFGFPSKALPLAVLCRLLFALEPRYNFILFGSNSEIAALLPDADNLRLVGWFRVVCADNVVDSLSRVAECSALIGSDSAFKTMSAMLRIPTIVWVGNYTDRFRDDNFIDPYTEAGVMSVFRYNEMTDAVIDDGVQFCLDRLEYIRKVEGKDAEEAQEA